MYIIYKTTNSVNGKIYIGLHKQDSTDFDVGCVVFDVGCVVFDVGCVVFDVGCVVFDVGCVVFDVGCVVFPSHDIWTCNMGGFMLTKPSIFLYSGYPS